MLAGLASRRRKIKGIILVSMPGIGEHDRYDLDLHLKLLFILGLLELETNLNNYGSSFLLFLELLESDLDDFLYVLLALSACESSSLVFLLISSGVCLGGLLGEGWGFSDLGVDLFVQLFD